MFAISPTDLNWFSFLKNKAYNSEINFWTPTPWRISKLSKEDKLYFMLKSPIRKIGGYGHFLAYKEMSVDAAWNKFGYKNGCESKREFIDRLDNYKLKNSTDERSVVNTKIGCIVLSNAIFFDESDYIDLEDFDIEFSKYIVKIKYYEKEGLLPDVIKEDKTDYKLISELKEKTLKIKSLTTLHDGF